MRVLITSSSHESKGQTGTIVSGKVSGEVEVKLDGSGEIVSVANGQYKITKIQD